MYYLSNFLGALQRGRGCVTSRHCHLKSKAATQSRQIPPRSTKFLETVFRNPSTHAAPLTVTHPLIPSREGNHPHSTYSLPKRTQLPISPLERGRGCVTPEHSYLKIKSNHQKPTNATSPNSSKTCSTHPAPLSITHPSIPSQEGNTYIINHSFTNRNQHFKPPLSRGAGGV